MTTVPAASPASATAAAAPAAAAAGAKVKVLGFVWENWENCAEGVEGF
jgi:hypothetical protein